MDDNNKLTPTVNGRVISFEEAMAKLDAQEAEFRAKREAGWERDAAEMRSLFNLDRVEALEGVLRELVDAPVQHITYGYLKYVGPAGIPRRPDAYSCTYCHHLWFFDDQTHTNDCPVARARRLLDGAG